MKGIIMTDQNYAHITILADRTGSMGTRTDPGRTRAMDATDGIRGVIREQAAAPGRTTFSLVQFCAPGLDAMIERIAWFAAGDARALREWHCQPYGSTPLLDAVGTVVTDTGDALAALAEDQRPARVFFVIATDGEENVSREYKLAQVKDMITRQQKQFGWEFLFLGAGIDAFAEAGAIGVSAAATMDVDAGSSVAMAASYSSTSDAMTRARATGDKVSYTDAERAAASKTRK